MVDDAADEVQLWPCPHGVRREKCLRRFLALCAVATAVVRVLLNPPSLPLKQWSEPATSAVTNQTTWTPTDEWLQECAANLSKTEPAPFQPHHPGHDKRHLYRLGDCLRKCVCEPGHGNETMLTQYKNLACPLINYGRNMTAAAILMRYGNNMTVIEQLLTMRDGKSGFTRPDPDSLVIHLRLGDIIEKSNATARTMLTQGAAPGYFTNQWIKSVHEYLSDIQKSNTSKIDIVGGSHKQESKKSRIYAGCLEKAIARAGYMVSSMRTDGSFSADQDFYYISHAKKLIVAAGGFSSLMAHMAKRHGGVIIGRTFGYAYRYEE